MHELSIAQSIVELAEQQLQKHGAVSAEELELEIGSFAGVDWNALEFALESAVKGSGLENARMVRRTISGEGLCSDCETRFPVENFLSACPACGSYAVKIVRGKELRIKSIVIK